MEGDAFLQVLELDGAADFGQDGESVGIPLSHDLTELDCLPLFHLQVRAIDDLVALLLAAAIIDDGDGAGAVHSDQIALTAADRSQVDEADGAIVLGFEARLLIDTRGGSTDVEGPHGELGAGLADGLRGDDADRFAEFDDAAGAEVTAVAEDADAATGFAGEHGANLDALDTGRLDGRGKVFGDFLVDVDDDLAFVVLDLLKGDAAHDAIAQRLDDLAGFDDRSYVDAFDGLAVAFGDDDVLGHVHQTAGEVAGVSSLERGIGEALARPVRGDEVFQHGEPFTEVGRDGGLDDFAGGLGHEATHAGELADLLFRSASAGVGHDVDGVHGAFFVGALHVVEHLVGNAFSDRRPDLYDLVVALAVGDGAVEVLLLNGDGLFFRIAHGNVLGFGDDHVIESDGKAADGRVMEAEFLDVVEHLHGELKAVVEVAVVDELADTLLLEQAVDVGHLLGERIVEDGAADGGGDELTLVLDRLRVGEVLIVVSGAHLEHGAGVAKTDGAEGFDLAGFERHEDFLDVGEDATFALRTLLGLGQVVEAEHHVLRRHGDGLTRRGREDVVRGEHEHGRFDLGFRGKRDVHGHLVAIEVGVEGGADQGVNLDRLAFDEDGLKRLDAEAVERRSTVEQHRMVADDFLEDVPHDGFLELDHFLGLLDGGAVAGLLKAVIDEGLEELEGHLFRKAALVELELGADDYDGAAGVVDALAEKVLAEAALLALQRIGEGLERAVVGSAQDAATAAVIEQGVDRFLKHALFVAHDDFGRMQVHELLQPVVAVDDAAIEIVEIGGGKAAAVERNEGAKLRRDHGDHVEDHPLGLVAGLAEGLDDLEALGILEALLQGGFGLHALAQFDGELVDVNALEEFLDGLGAHHAFEAGGAVLLVDFAELGFVLDDLAFADGRVAGIDHDVALEVEDGLEVAKGDIEQVADARRKALEEPDVRAGRGELDVAEALATDFGDGDFDAALVADHAAVLHALVLAAEALPVGDGAEYASAEETVALRFKSAVVDGFRFGDFAMRPAANLLGRSQRDANRIEVGDGAGHFERAGTVQGVPPC